MAANKGTLVNLEREKQFLFSYRKKIRRGKKFIVSGNTRQAIIDEHVRQKIGAFDPDLYERLSREEIEKEDIPYDFWFSPEGNILPHSRGITVSYFASLRGVYFCKRLRDRRRHYQWLAVRFFF